MWEYKVLGQEVYNIVYCFIIFGFMGWIWETTKVSLEMKAFVNRGFLTGPIIPIYGFGGTIVYLILSPIQKYGILVFLCGMSIATVLEYITAVVMEHIFHAKWWDYSDYRIHFQGRICLCASLLWGILSIMDVYVFGPFMEDLISIIPRVQGEMVGSIILMLLSVDFVVTIVCALQLTKIANGLGALRDELVTYLVSTTLFEKKEELKEYMANVSISGIRERSFGAINELTKKFQLRIAKDIQDEEEQNRRVIRFREEVEAKFKSFFLRYKQKIEKGNLVHKRLLRAFPDFKLKARPNLLEDIKERWYRHKMTDKK